MRRAEHRNVKLLFLDFVDKLYAADRYRSMSEALKAEHRPHSMFYSPVVLFNFVV